LSQELFINKRVWNEFSPTELEEYIDAVFCHYKTFGFPYFPTSTEFRIKEINKALNYDYKRCIDQEKRLIKQTMHGLSLCWSYHPHHYGVPCNNMMTVLEAFDQKLKKVIAKRIKMGDNMSDNGLRKMLKIFTGVQCVSNFRPTAAAAIYHLIVPEGGTVYDMSAGYGGRCLGAHLAGVKYYGVEPCEKTHIGLQSMIDQFGLDASIKMEGSEIGGWLAENSVDAAFSSPPYFDCEKYSNEPTQSYIKYPSRHLWLWGFMRETLLECQRVVKKRGIIAINIQNVRSYPELVEDVIKLGEHIGMAPMRPWHLQLSNLAGGGHKVEPILLFRNEK